MLIKQQVQPTPITCVSTCMSMILGVPVEEVINEFHEKYYTECSITCAKYLQSKGLTVERMYADFSPKNIDYNTVYGLIVPSLNIEGGTHMVLMEVDSEGNWCIYDPNYKKESKKYYIPVKYEDNDNNLEVGINSYVINFSISVDDIKEFLSK